MTKFKQKTDQSTFLSLLNRILPAQSAGFLIHLPAELWEDTVKQMTYHPAFGPLHVKILSSTRSICEFELHYAPSEVNKKPVSIVVVEGCITHDPNFDGAFVELSGRLQLLHILELNLIVAGILLAFLAVGGFIFRGELNIGFIAWTVPLVYIFTLSATLRYLWNKPALLIEVARDKLENAHFSVIRPEVRKKQK